MSEQFMAIIIGALLFLMGFLVKNKTGKKNYLYITMGALIFLIGIGDVHF